MDLARDDLFEKGRRGESRRVLNELRSFQNPKGWEEGV